MVHLLYFRSNLAESATFDFHRFSTCPLVVIPMVVFSRLKQLQNLFLNLIEQKIGMLNSNTYNLLFQIPNKGREHETKDDQKMIHLQCLIY